MKDIEQIIRAVKTKHPAVSVHQLRVSQPGTDDDGLWFFGADDSEVEVQIESSTGMCPFLVETSENAERLITNSVSETVEAVSNMLHLTPRT